MEYKIVDFHGEIYWAKINGYTYAVDPKYLKFFKTTILKIK